MSDGNLPLPTVLERRRIIEAMDGMVSGGDPDVFLVELRKACSRYGMSRLARDTGINRVLLYRIVSSGRNPKLIQIMRIFGALGIKIGIALD